MSKRIDVAAVAAILGTLYPPPFDQPCRARERRRLGDAAGFKAGEADGHRLQNRSAAEALVLEIGSRAEAQDVTTYPGIDLLAPAGGKPAVFTHRDGTPYPELPRRSA
jgi:uncharacterized cupin superfamily protein